MMLVAAGHAGIVRALLGITPRRKAIKRYARSRTGVPISQADGLGG